VAWAAARCRRSASGRGGSGFSCFLFEEGFSRSLSFGTSSCQVRVDAYDCQERASSNSGADVRRACFCVVSVRILLDVCCRTTAAVWLRRFSSGTDGPKFWIGPAPLVDWIDNGIPISSARRPRSSFTHHPDSGRSFCHFRTSCEVDDSNRGGEAISSTPTEPGRCNESTRAIQFCAPQELQGQQLQ
jgi:hypothetical protein